MKSSNQQIGIVTRPCRGTFNLALALGTLALVACGGDEAGSSEPECNILTGENCADTSADADTTEDTTDTDVEGDADTTDDADTADTADTTPDTVTTDTSPDTDTDTDTSDTSVVDEICDNNVDDDGDGDLDCADDDCVNTLTCQDCESIAATQCTPINRACVDNPSGIGSCVDCLETFTENGAGDCVCDVSTCDAPPAPFCRGNTVVTTSNSIADRGTSCECTQAEDETLCGRGQICESGACQDVPTPQNPWIAYLRSFGFTGDLPQQAQYFVRRADGTGTERRLTNISGRKYGAAWSADAQTFYFVMRPLSAYELYALDVETGAIRQIAPLCPEAAVINSVTPLPDGTGLALATYDSAEADFGILRFDFETGACTELVDDSGTDESEPKFVICDDPTLYFTRVRGSTATMYAADIGSGTGSATAVSGLLGSASISPLCDKVCFITLEGTDTVLNCGAFNPSTRRASAIAAVAGSSGDSSPAFLPNQNFVALSRNYPTTDGTTQSEVVVLNLTTNAVTRLTDNLVLDSTPLPSPVDSTAVNPFNAP